MDPATQQPRSVDADGKVRLYASSAGKTQSLETQSLHLTTVPAPGAGNGLGGWVRRKPGAAKAPSLQLETAKADSPAHVVWESRGERFELNSGRLDASFDSTNKIKKLKGGAGIRLEREIKGSEPIVTTANSLDVHFTDGQWTQAKESGRVSAVQGDRRASAETGEWTRATGAVDLRGDAQIRDAESQTLADYILWNQQTGELHATGDVRTSYFSAGGARARSPAQAMPSAGPANVVAEELRANAKTGVATFTGNARLWQGDLVIQARQIELLRDRGELLADGGVRAAFPQTQALEAGSGKPGAARKHAESESGPVLWRVTADRLRYISDSRLPAKQGAKGVAGARGEAVLNGGVRAWSANGEIDAAKLVLQFERDTGGHAELTQANASGGVHVRQGQRWGQGQKAEYFAKGGKFVLSGGHPSLHDASGDLVTGSQLTFYVADDTILVESAKGSRTLTRHSVPK
jgi:lipopolysaccharide export system protein LptA